MHDTSLGMLEDNHNVILMGVMKQEQLSSKNRKTPKFVSAFASCNAYDYSGNLKQLQSWGE